MKDAITREKHRALLAEASDDFREGVAYACEVAAQELFWAPLRGETIPAILRRFMDEVARLRPERVPDVRV